MSAASTRSRAALTTAALVLVWCGACAHDGTASPAVAPTGEAPPPSDHVIEPPPSRMPRLSAAGLTHLMRGLYFVASGHASASIPHLRLSLIYDEKSAFVHERLSQAWGTAGEEKKAIATLEVGLRQRPEDPDLNLLAGHLAVKDRDFAAAERHFRLAMRGDRTLARAGPLLVDTLLWLERPDEAVNTARQLLAELPGDLDQALALAAFLEDHDQLATSLEVYRHTKRQRPADRAATIGEVRVLELLGRSEEAADSLVSLFAFYPDAPELYIEITRLLRRLGSGDATAYRNEALRQVEGDPRGRLQVAVGDLLEGSVEQGIAGLRLVIDEFPAYAGARIYLAELLGSRRDMAGCLAVLEVPADGVDRYHRTRAWCYSIGGEPQNVINELQRAVAAGDTAGDVLLEGARLLSNRFRERVARDYFELLRDALAEGIDADDLDLAEAMLDEASGRGEEAIARVRRVLPRQAQNPRFKLRLADLEVRFGDPKVGVELLEELHAEAPGDVIRLNALGFTLADLGERLDEAAVWLRRAYRQAPEDGFVIDSLGWLLHQQGRDEQALRLLERATRASINDPEILRHLGDVQHALGRPDDARRSYQRALEAFPNLSLRALLEERLAPEPPTPGAS